MLRGSPSVSLALIDRLKVCINLSASPLEDGWYFELKMCLIPCTFIKLANSSDVNCGPLSETTCSGKPNRAIKLELSLEMWSMTW